MTEQRPRLVIAECELSPRGEVKLEYSLEDLSLDEPGTFYCDNAFHGESGICCRKNGSERCLVYLSMIEQSVSTAYNSRNGNGKVSIPQGPRLAGPRNHTLQQGYLNTQQKT